MRCQVRSCPVELPSGRRRCHYHEWSRSHIVTGEEELGAQRWCRRCISWYPLSEEFWLSNAMRRLVCKACQREWNRNFYRARNEWAA